MHKHDFDLQNEARSDVNTIESQQATFNILAMVKFALSVTICQITTFNLSRMVSIKSLTFKMYVKVMSYNLAEYVVGW